MSDKSEHTHDVQPEEQPRLAKDLPPPSKEEVRKALQERAAIEWPAGVRVQYELPIAETRRLGINPNRLWRRGRYI